MKKIILILCITALSAGIPLAAMGDDNLSEERSFTFQFGLGFSQISYGAETDALISDMQSYGVDRAVVNLNIGLGWALREDLYFLISISGVGDRLYDSYNYMQFNTYLFGAGIRSYPFTTGLVLGLDIGASVMVALSDVGYSERSEYGTGFSLSAAYDFNKKLTGFSLQPGIKIDGFKIGNEGIGAASLYLNLVWK